MNEGLLAAKATAAAQLADDAERRQKYYEAELTKAENALDVLAEQFRINSQEARSKMLLIRERLALAKQEALRAARISIQAERKAIDV
jgi:hypothetical protein